MIRNLSSLGLRGTLSPKIAVFQSLTLLDMTTYNNSLGPPNSINGPLPDELGELTQLQYLSVAKIWPTNYIISSYSNYWSFKGALKFIITSVSTFRIDGGRYVTFSPKYWTTLGPLWWFCRSLCCTVITLNCSIFKCLWSWAESDPVKVWIL